MAISRYNVDYARMMELPDMIASEAIAFGRAGWNPVLRTKYNNNMIYVVRVKYLSVAQRQEATDLEFVQCEFESHR